MITCIMGGTDFFKLIINDGYCGKDANSETKFKQKIEILEQFHVFRKYIDILIKHRFRNSSAAIFCTLNF